MDQPMLEELIKELDAAIKSGKLKGALKSKPQLILPLRLALSLSQREFRKYLNYGISQQTLIKYENGKTTQMNDKILKVLSGIPIAEIKPDKILKNYEAFKHMQKHGQMTSERGKMLQRISLKKTSRKERELWGRKGAIIANSKQRFTEQEKRIDKSMFKD